MNTWPMPHVTHWALDPWPVTSLISINMCFFVPQCIFDSFLLHGMPFTDNSMKFLQNIQSILPTEKRIAQETETNALPTCTFFVFFRSVHLLTMYRISSSWNRSTYVWRRLVLHKGSSSRSAEPAKLDIGAVADCRHTSGELSPPRYTSHMSNYVTGKSHI